MSSEQQSERTSAKAPARRLDEAASSSAPDLLPTSEPPRIQLGIRVKLVALMAGTSFLILGILASYFPMRQIAEQRAGLRDRAATYARLAGLQLRPAVAFKDHQTAREVLTAIAKDPLVNGVAVYVESGLPLATQGRLSELGYATRHGLGTPRTFYLPGRVLVTSPVQTLEGPKGTFVLELSTRSALDARDRLLRASLGVGAGALLFGTLLAWGIARSLARRVEVIADAASAVAKGDLEQRLPLDGPRDEIGILAFGFDAMVRRLRNLIRQIHDHAREEKDRLERIVQERTSWLGLVRSQARCPWTTSRRLCCRPARRIHQWRMRSAARCVAFWSVTSTPDIHSGMPGSWLDGLKMCKCTLDVGGRSPLRAEVCRLAVLFLSVSNP